MQLFHVAAVAVGARLARSVVPCADKESDMTRELDVELDPKLGELVPVFIEDGLPDNPVIEDGLPDPVRPLDFDPRALFQRPPDSNSGDTK
jgi:hypothetical protein